MIAEGRIELDGQTALPGAQIVPGESEVRVDGRRLVFRRIRPVVLLLNKPRGILCSHRDPHHGETVFDLLRPPYNSMRLVLVGRLDKDSEGLLLLTNDGTLAQRLAHPSHAVLKRYQVELDRPLDTNHVPRLLRGVSWEGERLRADKVIPLKSARGADRGKAEIHLRHGKKREIRNLLYAFGYRVRRLRRIQIGGLRLRGLAAGQYRELTDGEISRLFD